MLYPSASFFVTSGSEFIDFTSVRSIHRSLCFEHIKYSLWLFLITVPSNYLPSSANLSLEKKKNPHSALAGKYGKCGKAVLPLLAEIHAQTVSEQEHCQAQETNFQYAVCQVVCTAHLSLDTTEYLNRNGGSQIHDTQFSSMNDKNYGQHVFLHLNELVWPLLGVNLLLQREGCCFLSEWYL